MKLLPSIPRPTDGWSDRQMDRQTDGQTDGQMDRLMVVIAIPPPNFVLGRGNKSTLVLANKNFKWEFCSYGGGILLYE